MRSKEKDTKLSKTKEKGHLQVGLYVEKHDDADDEHIYSETGEDACVPGEVAIQCDLGNRETEIVSLQNKVDKLDKELIERNAEIISCEMKTKSLKTKHSALTLSKNLMHL